MEVSLFFSNFLATLVAVATGLTPNVGFFQTFFGPRSTTLKPEVVVNGMVPEFAAPMKSATLNSLSYFGFSDEFFMLWFGVKSERKKKGFCVCLLGGLLD
jgi:hypothetical protein